jgi:ADP-ribose pyrophosphatase YjhB (NUDIX family)
LEYGEGLIDGLKREFIEECQAEIGIIRHIYTTDFFIRSAFNDSQVLSVYYLVHSINPLELNFKENSYDFDGDLLQAFRWRNLEDLHPGDVTFPSDKRVVELILNEFKP